MPTILKYNMTLLINILCFKLKISTFSHILGQNGLFGGPKEGPTGFLPQMDIPLIQAYHFEPQKDTVD